MAELLLDGEAAAAVDPEGKEGRARVTRAALERKEQPLVVVARAWREFLASLHARRLTR